MTDAIRRKIQTHMTALAKRTGTNWAAPIRAKLGNPSTGDLFVDGLARTVYIHFPGDESRGQTTALQGQFSRQEIVFNRPVWVKLNAAGVYELEKADAINDAIFAEGIEEIHDQAPVLLNQVMYGTLQPVAGSPTLLVVGAMYGDDWVSDQPTADFSTSPLDTASAAINIPTNNNRAIGVLIQIDAATNTLEYKQSSEFVATMPLPVAYANSLLSTPDSGRYRIGYCKLVAGMTASTPFSPDQIWCVPEIIALYTAPTSVTDTAYDEGAAPATPAANQVVIYAKTDGLMYSKDDLGAETLMSSAAGDHITGGAQEVDGDKLDIDWNPTYYNPATTPTEADNVDNLTAHLYGIDQLVGIHASRHITGAGDEVDGDKLDVDWNPTYYTPSTTPTEADSVDNLTAHLYGVDVELGSSAVRHSYAILRDEKATTTDGGSASATTWNNRNLNTELYDPDGIVSVSSNQFTPIAGDYIIQVSAPAFRVGPNRVRLYNVTGTSPVEEGQNAYSNNAANYTVSYATLKCKFTANGTDAYRIDHYATSAQATNGLGVNVGDGSNEVYLSILLIKVG